MGYVPEYDIVLASVDVVKLQIGYENLVKICYRQVEDIRNARSW